jgi:ABC-2 type transport system permease protein
VITDAIRRPQRERARQSWDHFLHVTAALAVTEFKLRYFGSTLGYLWSVLRPLFLFGVLYIVFTKIVRTGTSVPHYPVALLLGLVFFNFFSEATSSGLSSLIQREHLLRKVAFPRAAIPVAVSATAVANFALGLVIVLILALFNGVDPAASWLLLMPLAAAIVVFATTISLLLSILFVRYRDVQPLWEVILQVTFWVTPIIYGIGFVPAAYRQFVMYNPLAVAIEQARRWVIGSDFPSASDVLGSDLQLLIPAAVYIAVAVLGIWTFSRRAGYVAEEL